MTRAVDDRRPPLALHSHPMKTQILILGGGFGGLGAALEFERHPRPDVEVTLVTEENFFLFTPMLHEVAASDLDLTNIVSPLRRLLRRVKVFVGAIREIDLANKKVLVAHGFSPHAHSLAYDHLVLALGSVTNFFGLPGLAERALCMKSLADAVALRNRLIAHLEEADTECAISDRRPLLTYVVAGGGFAGVETIGSLNDFLHEALPHYPNLRRSMIRLVLVHPGDHVLPELGPELGGYASRQLANRGIELRPNTKVAAVTDREVRLTDGEIIESFSLVWTAGTSPSPLLEKLALPKVRGRIQVEPTLQVPGHTDIWALGDCASIPDLARPGQTHPPTAQHASREGPLVARNILAALSGRTPAPFRFRTLGLLASIGHRTGVARILGVNFSGFVAWWMWRTIYLAKLPGAEKKLRVALEWTLDLLFKKDFVLYQRESRSRSLIPSAPGESGQPLPVRSAVCVDP